MLQKLRKIPKMLLVLGLVHSSGVKADTITIRADNWCPFNCDPKAIEKRGFLIDIADQVFAASGHKVDYQLENWARAKSDLRAGKWDAVVGAYRVDGPDFIFPAEGLGLAQDCFWIKTGKSWRYDGNTLSLKGVKFGAVQNYAYSDKIDAYIKSNSKDVELVGGDDPLALNLGKLEKGRIDAFFESKAVVKYKFVGVPMPVSEAGCEPEQEVFIAFSPSAKRTKSTEYAKILTDGFQNLRKSGALKTIYAKYGLDEHGQ